MDHAALLVFFFQAEDGIRDDLVTGVQTCALPISTEWRDRFDRAILPFRLRPQPHPNAAPMRSDPYSGARRPRRGAEPALMLLQADAPVTFGSAPLVSSPELDRVEKRGQRVAEQSIAPIMRKVAQA